MINKIKKRLDKELLSFLAYVNKKYSLRKISPILFRGIRNFVLRDGKRLRPILFIISYKGFSNRDPKSLYRGALCIELLHNFLLIHDDIVDKSAMRRGKPSMHKLLGKYISPLKSRRFTGEDLAIIIGDVIYAIAIESFFSIEEKHKNKEHALKRFVEASCFTGCGEFIEMLYGAKALNEVTRNDIYRIYDYKTAHYTFVAPLVAGAMLAGASKRDVDRLSECGIYLGRAFQIRDDIIGIFGKPRETGKSSFTDLEENKKTLLIWYAYNQASRRDRARLKSILNKGKITARELSQARRIIKSTGSLDYAEKEIGKMLEESVNIIKTSRIKHLYKKVLINYTRTILSA